ncbi:MAG: iron-sulfur cluster assembly scaffold protein [Dehalococcoidaceae bacterium]|nr:iron-sulfur cluster assembly scaffold protein [Dehalococcoidaceae bacterium]
MEESYSKNFMRYFHQRIQAGTMQSPDLQSRVSNPVCGDELQLFISLNNNTFVDAKFLTSGCASTIAIASYGTEYIVGKSISTLKKITSMELQKGIGGLPTNKKHASALFIQAIKKLEVEKLK